ncbi:uncharacterized protein KNN_00619 [Bacillus thuringiensis serovar tolworthi]|uniref:Uncharacterized protein n=2 Tax=Bacillus TaxID=1386 RepID=A0A9W4ES70_BACTO|nr:uncharacterized protein KNN_00619 [Bacillus thuringiensis serovar tolworthi]
MEQDINETSLKRLSPICDTFNLDLDEIRRDIKKVVTRTEMDVAMVVGGFRTIILKLFYKRKDNVSYSQVKADIYDVMRKLSKPEKGAFAHRLVGGHCHAMLLYLMDEYEKEILALE